MARGETKTGAFLFTGVVSILWFELLKIFNRQKNLSGQN